MIRTKNRIFQPIRTDLDFPENLSAERIESLLEIFKTSLAAVVALLYDERLKKALFLFVTTLPILFLCSCTNKSKNAAQMDVEFEWQQIDKGAQENPEIRLIGVPEGTKRFLFSLVDLNLNGFNHGSGFVDNDGSGIIARGAVKGSYNGPDPPYPNLKHRHEITVEALDEKGTVIGIGKKAKVFLLKD